MNKKSIRKKFLIYILPVQLATLLILGVVAYIFSSRIVMRQAEENFTETINVVFQQIESELRNRVEKISLLARSPSFIKFVSAPHYKSSFDVDVFNFQRGNGLVLGEPEIGGLVNFPVGFLANEGNKKVVSAGTFPSEEFVGSDGFVRQHVYLGGSNDADFENGRNAKLDRKEEVWFKEAMKGDVYINEPRKEHLFLREYNPVLISLKEMTIEEELLSIAIPHKIGDNIVGVLMVTTTPDFLKIAKPEDLGNTLLMVVDKEADTVIMSGRTSSMESLSHEDVSGIFLSEEGRVIDYGALLVMYKKIPVAGWSVVIAQDKRDIFSSVFSLRNRMVLIIAASIILMAVLVTIIIGKLLMPIINLRTASERIANGELGLVVPKDGDDEIAMLTESFNTMSMRVKRMHVELEKSNIRLANIGYVRKQMLQLMSHELRTPVTGIVGFYELLDEQIKSGNLKEESTLEEVKDLLGNMGMSIKEFENMVMRLTRAASLVAQEKEKGVAEDFAPADLKTAAESVIRKVGKQFNERNIELKTDLPEVCYVACPADMLSMVFEEAISNAVKYSKSGSSVAISGRVKEDAVEIDISDHGSGIPKKYIDEIVEPFFEVADALHHSTGRYKAEGGGLGLGLTIIINIVKKYGGALEIRSKEGEGTTLHITMPVVKE